ncbi:hypothetical protein EBS80_02410, partial [bacterium]|nr:hypothetical protein [bacterium]
MFKRCIHIALAILAALGTTLPGALLPFAARASAPNTLSYQGRLRDEGGIVVADGDYSFSFTLWDDLNAGTADWTENQTVAVTDGYFSVQLGTIDPFQDGAGQETDFSQPLFLEVVVEAETLTPRVTINSVAYALSSRAAESYASEAAAEAASEPYGGRMYYNTTSGHLYVYDAIGLSWEDTTAAGTIDSAYGAFGSDPAVVTVDNLEGQGDLAFLLDGADLLVQDGGGTFVTFADDGTTTFASTVGFNGQLALGDNGDTVAINSSDWDVSATGDMTGIGSLAMNGNLTQTGVTDFSTGTGTVSLNGATTVANGNAFTANGQLALGDNGDTVAIDSSDWDIDVTGAITGVSFDANGTGNSISNIESVDISDATITGDDLASSIAGTGLALTAGSPDVLDVGAGNGIAVAADSVAVALLAVADGTGTVSSDSGLEFQGAGNDKLTLLQGCTADQILKWNDGASTWGCADDDSTPGGIPTLDDVYQQGGTVNVSAYDVLFDLSDDTNDYKFVIDNNSTGAIATAFSITSNGLGSSVGTAVDLSDADIATALALGSNDVTVGGATISSSLSLGDGSSTADINSAGWHINTAGDMFGIGQINANGLVSLSAGLTVSAGNISLTDDTGTAWSINNNGAAILESVTVGGDAVNDFTGTGLAMSGNSLTASLGTAVDASEITDNTITLADVAASLTFDSDLTFVSDSATNDYHLILDNSSAGDVASFLVVTTSGEGGTVGTAVDLSDADIATALALGSNDVTVGGATISSS